MSKPLDSLDEEARAWIAAQRLVFVATAPLARDGHVNCSPRGGDCLRILGDRELVLDDLTGSGAETAAHVRENGRIVLMLCAFEGPPRIMRFHGRAEFVPMGHPRHAEFEALFESHPGRRAFYRIDIDRISSSCGYKVPLLDYRGERDVLDRWSEKEGPEGVAEFRREKNRSSIDGLPAFD